MKYKELYSEYTSLLSERSKYIEKSNTLKKGYISIKTISGKQYAYLQRKIDGKINSEYIKADMVPHIKSELHQRYEIKNKINRIDDRLARLETAVKGLDNSLYRKFIILKRCSEMDSMPMEMRRKTLDFSSAMTALEGIPASEETEIALSLWTAGQHSFIDSYLQTLAKFNLIEA